MWREMERHSYILCRVYPGIRVRFSYLSTVSWILFPQSTCSSLHRGQCLSFSMCLAFLICEIGEDVEVGESGGGVGLVGHN